MKHQKHQGQAFDFLASFPFDKHPDIRINQKEALEILSSEIGVDGGSAVFELPTGSGKTDIGYAFLEALRKKGLGPLFYITPNKTQVDQIKTMHPEVIRIYGRNEYKCLYYSGQNVTAEQSPCSMLDCPHRVNQETGETEAGGVEPCPYLLDKYLAKQGKGIVVCTIAFYLFSHFGKSWGKPVGLVIDEAHRIANTVRSCLSYEITDYHLQRAIDFLVDINPEAANILNIFLKKMEKIIKRRSKSNISILLEPFEIRDLLKELGKINKDELQKNVRKAIKQTGPQSEEIREVMKRLETVVYNLSRYYFSLEYSLPTNDREPLNYTYGYYLKDKPGKEKVGYRLFIKSYYVGPLIRRMVAPFTLAYSATIGDAEIFSFDSGLDFPFRSFSSDFPIKNTRLFVPVDTANLAMKTRGKREPTKTLRRIAKGCFRLNQAGHRCLVVVASNAEREKFLLLCQEEGVKAVSYSNGVSARTAANLFKEGEGNVLIGTAANYGEGIDLPKQIAPIIFFLRPGYPRPNDPATVFEERRFRNLRWQLWNWRVMIESLQVRGRNVRDKTGLGVTIFVSQQFRRFIPASLPEYLRGGYQGGKKFEECIEEAIEIFSK